VITVVLHGEPRGKGRPRSAMVRPRFGKSFIRVHTDEETEAYEKALKLTAKVAMGAGRRPLEGPLDVVVTAVMPIPNSWSRKKREAALAGQFRPTVSPDWDNFGKVTDALNKVVWLDDSQVVRGTVIKVYGERPLLRVEVKAADVSSAAGAGKVEQRGLTSPPHVDDDAGLA
jgi:Holliday junction resolvase RusA-like endonuclease